jgi:undecaprenyl-diphosphatase
MPVDFMLLFKALILGVVEGLTEFLPISSTGHLILVGDLLDFNDDKGKVFEVAIQTGAIMAVVWDYRVKFGAVARGLPGDPMARRFLLNLFLAFVPIAALGLLFGKVIKAHLFAPVPVALAFIIGGLVIFWAERRKHVVRVQEVDDLQWQDALKLGFAQCFALIPGTSRSGATIIGGLFIGLSRKAAAEFSFFLAVPTLGMATLYDLVKHRDLLSWSDLPMFAVGFVAAFISAALAVRVFIRYVASHDFTLFVIYRIVFGVVVLVTAYTGLVNWTVH